MRIGFDFRLAGIRNGGLGRYTSQLLLALLKINSRDEFAVFFNPETADTHELALINKHSNALLIEAPFRHYSASEQIYFPRLLSKYSLNLVHFPNFNVPIRYKGAYVVTIHDMVHHRLSGHKKSRIHKFYAYKYIIEKAAIRARKIITVSEASRKDIINTLNISESNVEVTYPGVEVSYPEEDEIDRVRTAFLLSRPYFLFAGVLERKKNIPWLTRAFDLFLDEYRLDIDLCIAGKEDPHYPEIRSDALEINNRSRVVFTGFVTDSELMSLYAGAYAFTTASLYEGFGMPGVEAMKFGLPIIAANTEVFNEIYDNAALYFDPSNVEDAAEKMHIIARDAMFYEARREKSLARAELFDWNETAKQTMRIYREVLGYND